MLKCKNTEQPHTAYSTSAMAIEHSRSMAIEHSRNMETRDHSNGVSPKNQRSRGNFLNGMRMEKLKLINSSREEMRLRPLIAQRDTFCNCICFCPDGNVFNGSIHQVGPLSVSKKN